MSKSFAAVDFFCGIGGLSYGIQQAGIPVLAGYDIDESCRYAYETNVKAKFLAKDIRDVSISEVSSLFRKEDVRVLVGCAPCQPFSQHSLKISRDTKEKSSRWNLIHEFLRVATGVNAQVISMENVPNLVHEKIFSDFVETLRTEKYHVSYSVVFCPDYGIPQRRRRLVLLASKLGDINLIPPTHTKVNYPTVRDAIGKLKNIKSGERDPEDSMHYAGKLNSLNMKRIKSSKPNGSWEDWSEDLRLKCHKKKTGLTYKSVYGRMAWDEPSPTITTQFHIYGTGRFGHPEQDRPISIREGALLQTFPKHYSFYPLGAKYKTVDICTHIGNAVPVDLGKVIGQSILNHFQSP